MKKANILLLIALFASLALVSCESSDSLKANKTSPTKGSDTIANPITYEVLIKNPDIDDEWKSECLENTNVELMAKDIIMAVIDGKLKAFDYYDNHQLSKSEIKAILKKNGEQSRIGNIQFKEEWYWDRSSFQLQKKVKSIMFGYEISDENNKIKGYRASFVVNLGNE